MKTERDNERIAEITARVDSIPMVIRNDAEEACAWLLSRLEDKNNTIAEKDARIAELLAIGKAYLYPKTSSSSS